MRVRNLPDGSRTTDSSPEYCRQSIETSLKRLELPHVDLYYVHRLDGKTPIEKTMEVMKQLKEEGKIKYIGLSEMSADSLRRACKVVHVDAVQIEYSYGCPPVIRCNLVLTFRQTIRPRDRAT